MRRRGMKHEAKLAPSYTGKGLREEQGGGGGYDIGEGAATRLMRTLNQMCEN